MKNNRQIIVAVSGGLDSMVLLHLLQQTNVDLIVAHVNYNLRDQESIEDQVFIKSYCLKHKLDFKCKNVRLKEDLANTNGNLQAKARDIRYAFFKELMDISGAPIIALAHHRNDQLETFYFNILRKSGIAGLSGMSEWSRPYWRPFLSYTKDDLMQYAIKHRLSWREDSSNLSTKYSRNKLRNIIPELEKEIPTLTESVMFLNNLFEKKQKELEKKVALILPKINETDSLNLSQWNELDEFCQFEFWKQLGEKSTTFNEFKKFMYAQNGSTIKLKGTFSSARKHQDFIKFYKDENFAFSASLMISEVDKLPEEFTKSIVYFDVNRIKGKLQLRKWQIGDRIKPIGLTGSRLVSDCIKDAKIDHAIRSEVLVATDDNQVLWIPDIAVSREAIATSKSEKIFKIEVKRS